MLKKMNHIRLLAAALVLVLISCIGASFLQTDGGRVTITDARIPMPNGEMLRTLIYRPASATKQSPAPCVITSHGYHATLETQDITAVELARRGFVVFSMDTYSAGDSSGTVEEYGYNRSYYGLGMLQLVEYVYDNIDYIDRDRIGITGHSTGGRNVAFTLDAYGRNEYGKVYADQPEDGSSYTTKVKSALILAFFPDHYLLNNIPSGVNVGINFARYDEGAPVQVSKVEGYQWADMTVSPEAKFFINTTTPDAFTLDADIQVNEKTGKEDITLSGYDDKEKVEIGRYYGSIEDGTMRVVYNPVISHQLQFFSKTNAAITNQFFMDTLGSPNPIPASDQTWFLKECFNGLGVLGFFLFLVPFAGLLLQTPFFASIVQPLKETPAAVAAKKNKLLSIGSKVLLAVIPGITVMPIFSGLAYGMIFTNAVTNNSTDFFPQPGPNAIVIWALLNGLIALAIFGCVYYIDGKKCGDQIEYWGVKTSWPVIGKCVLLAGICMCVSYQLVLFADRFFKTDFRFWSFAIRAADGIILRLWIRYLPFMLVFWLVISLLVNAGAVEGEKEWKHTLMCTLINIAGLVGLVAIQFIVLFSTGQAMWHANRSWVNICLIIPFIPMMIFGTIIIRRMYKKTGTIYLGAFTMAFVATLLTVANANTIMRI